MAERRSGISLGRVRGAAVLALGALLGVGPWAGCGTARPAASPEAAAGEAPPARTVELSVDRESYSPLLSSTVGIGLTPRYSASRTSPPFRYHWRTNYGYFVRWGPPDYQVEELGPDASSEGKVYWSYDPVEIDQRNKPEVEVAVRVRDAKTLDTWAESRLKMTWENSDTAVVSRGSHAR